MILGPEHFAAVVNAAAEIVTRGVRSEELDRSAEAFLLDAFDSFGSEGDGDGQAEPTPEPPDYDASHLSGQESLPLA